MVFEKFTHRRRPVIDIPMVSVLKSGQLGINQKAYDKYFKNYKYAVLYYDKTRKLIGIKPANDASSETYSIRVGRDGRLANISAIAFFKYYKIPHENSRSHRCKWDNKENMLIIDLKEAQKELPLK